MKDYSKSVLEPATSGGVRHIIFTDGRRPVTIELNRDVAFRSIVYYEALTREAQDLAKRGWQVKLPDVVYAQGRERKIQKVKKRSWLDRFRQKKQTQ